MSASNPFSNFLEANKFVLLDGGLATELEQLGFHLNHPLWSAKILIENPDAIRQLHRSYLEAEADCIATSSYQLSFAGCEQIGLSNTETTKLMKLSVSIAHEAIAEYRDLQHNGKATRKILAASLGPFGAYLANGSEYTGKYEVPSKMLFEFHIRRWDIMAQTQADLIAFETIPNIFEAEVIRRMAEDFPDTSFWISFCCKDTNHLSDGTPLQMAANLFSDLSQVAGIGINCTAPSLITPLIQAIKRGAPNKNILAYPNSGETYDPLNHCWIEKKKPWDFSLLSGQWYQSGAKIIGGCCRTGQEHIVSIRHCLKGIE